MPTYRPILSALDLPNEGEGQEIATRDLKRETERTERIHMAKDVAAFANHLGGTLVIGAKELNGRVHRYYPLDEKTANEQKAAFSQAVRDLCSPKPVFEALVLPRETGFVLIVNVEPEIGSLVGVKVKGDKERNGIGEDSYLFPVRTGIDSTFIPPEKLPMLMDPRYRRLVVMLSKIPPQTRIVSKIAATASPWVERRLVKVDPETNAIQFDSGDMTKLVHMPIDLVMSVLRTEGGQWRLILTHEAQYAMQE